MTLDEPDRDTSFLYGFARRGDADALVSRLKNAEDPVVRRRAAELLGDFDDLTEQARQYEVTEGLITAAIEDEDDSVRARAIDALYRHGRAALGRLVDRLSDDDAEITDGVTTDLLTSWLDTEYPEFRLVAAAALGEFGDASVVADLVDSLDDPDPRVRSRALQSIGELGDNRCVPYLRDRLTDEEVSVRRAAVTALASVGTDGALNTLVPVAIGAETETVRWMAADELGSFKNDQAFAALLNALADDSQAVVRAALLSLLDHVTSTTDDRASDLRERIAKQLWDLRAQTTVPPLIEVFEESPHPNRREQAVWLLGHALSGYDETAVDHLLEALDSDHESVAAAAQAALGELDDPEVRERLRFFRERGEASQAALDRAAEVLEGFEEEGSGEVITNSVDITYVRNPADYTSSQQDDEE